MVSAWVVFALGVLVGTLLMVAVDYWLLKIYWNMLTPAEPPAPRSYTKPTLAPVCAWCFCLLRGAAAQLQSSHLRDRFLSERCIPQALQEFLRKHPRPQQSHQRDELPEETCHALNFVNSFLFRELRDTIPVKRCVLGARHVMQCMSGVLEGRGGDSANRGLESGRCMDITRPPDITPPPLPLPGSS